VNAWRDDVVGDFDDRVADNVAVVEESGGTADVHDAWPVAGAEDAAVILSSYGDGTLDWLILVRAGDADWWILFTDYSGDGTYIETVTDALATISIAD
jgi:hypothetical protein